MAVKDTLIGRLKKLLRIEFDIKTAAVTGDTELGGSPIGFDPTVIKQEFRKRVNTWFKDLIPAFASVSWDVDTTVSDVVAELISNSTIPNIGKIKVYQGHVEDLAAEALDDAAGAGAPSVPVADRPAVQEAMNTELETSLLTDVSIADLAGDRATIVSNVADRMVI